MTNAFEFMDKTSLQGKTHFVEKLVLDYKHETHAMNYNANSMTL
jgi:hypothetical protein